MRTAGRLAPACALALLVLAASCAGPPPERRGAEPSSGRAPSIRPARQAGVTSRDFRHGPVSLPGQATEMYGEDSVPSGLSRDMAARAGAILGRRLEPDGCLERAAGILLETGGTGCVIWPAWLEEPSLHHAGCYDTGAYSLLFCTDDESAAPALEKLAGGVEGMKGKGLTHVGAARRPADGFRWSYAVLLVGRSLDLAAFPRSLPSFQGAVLRGSVEGAGERVTAYRMGPGGRVEELPVDQGRGGDFTVDVEGLPMMGEHWLELMLFDRSGPHVAALFPVYVDVPVPATAKPPPGIDLEADTPEQAEVVLYELVNLERGQRGLPQLSFDPMLSHVARGHARDMRDRDYFAHIDVLGDGPRERAAREGYRARIMGENLARSTGASEAHQELMASPTHRANLLDPRYTHVGIGVVDGRGPAGRLYWVVENFSLPQREMGAAEAAQEARRAIERMRAAEGRAPLVRDRGLDRVAAHLAGLALRGRDMEDLNRRAGEQMRLEGVPYRSLIISRQILTDPAELQPVRETDWVRERVGVGVEVRPVEDEARIEYVIVVLLAR